ncbi:MCP methyltransferase, CheR-type [Ferroglobus placidus DSM 10642]|uniref:protein-glutamate O-methyltransferase n=1 Tax=Ferroglobus placidus (strain DSM 10642 / AEDII12DO) TaxID=589924 RepID=D3RXL8_FERPA|nr:protein-glutamate O-methyltransferase CheR [Ferroglobus placidus]ADC65231.1 MCP methyltransferase, CheR-type [Ferroglobus placidus DSM 10642]
MDLTFNSIINYVAKHSGINLGQYRESYIRRRIELRMKSVGCTNLEEYYKFLRKNGKKEVEKLINTIAINVTEFMRDVTPFEKFMDIVLKDIARKKENVRSNIIRIWSAGCANGEEPYTIAMCIYETLGKNWNFTIYATDIDEDSLEKGRVGIYEKQQLKNLKEEWIKKYFERDGEKFRVKGFLKKHIRFKRHDLTTEPPVSRFFDVIFCRNVVIYFNEDQKLKVFNDFYNALVTGGYLIIGKSETLPGEFKDKFEVVDIRDKIYKKI